MVFVLVGTISILFVGIYLDKTNRYLFVLRTIAVTSTCAMASSIFLIPTGNIWAAILFCVMGGACIIPIVPVCYALSTEVTHPVQPALVLGLLANTGNFLLFISDVVYLSLLNPNNAKPKLCLMVMTINPLLCILLSTCVKEDLRRINAKIKESLLELDHP